MAPDAKTSVQGRVVDIASTPVDGADVTTDLHGVTVEVFDFAAPLTDVAKPGRSKRGIALLVASAINLRNPNLMFGADPFGFGTGSHVTRLTATLEPIGAAATEYTFTLGVNAGGQLLVNGTRWSTFRPAPDSSSRPAARIDPGSGPISIEILAFDNGNPEVQLLVEAPGYEVEVPEPDELTPTIVPYSATSQADGTFSVAGVPTVLGDIRVRVSKLVDGRTGARTVG